MITQFHKSILLAKLVVILEPTTVERGERERKFDPSQI